MSCVSRILMAALLAALAAPRAYAQVSVHIAGYDIIAGRQERLGEGHFLLSEGVELARADTKLFAEEVEVFEADNRALARGNVVFTQGLNRIAADRADFNTRTALGTFYNAYGISAAKPPRPQQTRPGSINVPQQTGVDTDVYFFGETIVKEAPKKYRITNGGFSTCVQPTPRWDLSADTVVLNIDDYTLLRQAILKVKGVPMFYLPVMYYPSQEDGRATGFLLPGYTHDKYKGHSVEVPFFWAISRSQDATIEFKNYSQIGWGTNGEYRYVTTRGGGTVQADLIDQKGSTVGGRELAAQKTFTVYGSAAESLPHNLFARASANYFSDYQTNQVFNTDPRSATRNQRTYGANLVGAWRLYSLNATFDRTESFYSQTTGALSGNGPRVAFSRNERPITRGSPLYFQMSTEVAHLDRVTRNEGQPDDDRSFGRFDISPTLRYPFKKWQWFTVNSSLNWRDTFYTRTTDPVTNLLTDENLNRSFFTMSSTATGPVFMRIWNTPGNAYAERFKHTIEPTFRVDRTTTVESRERIPQFDSTDSPYGDTTSFTYGVSNRFYAKRRVGLVGIAQEIASIDVTQSYYTDARASQVDRNFNSSSYTNALNKYSPILISARATPSPALNATVRAEIDSRYKELRTLSITSSYNFTQRFSTSPGWSQRFYIAGLQGFDNPAALDKSLVAFTRGQTADSKYGFTHSIFFDVLRKTLTDQSITGYYNAQCCGFAVSFQQINRGVNIPTNRVFSFGFSLAGLGSFSPLSNMGGTR